jgi:hypothetical protein
MIADLPTIETPKLIDMLERLREDEPPCGTSAIFGSFAAYGILKELEKRGIDAK